MLNNRNTREYWEKNISKWGTFYANSLYSEEDFNSSKWIEYLYRKIIMPTESRLMKKRYGISMINQYIHKGMTVVDVGCGIGIFTVEMLKREACVFR